MTKEIYLAAGCFWGAEHYLKCVRGVVKTETGYANGNISHPTYRPTGRSIRTGPATPRPCMWSMTPTCSVWTA